MDFYYLQTFPKLPTKEKTHSPNSSPKNPCSLGQDHSTPKDLQPKDFTFFCYFEGSKRESLKLEISRSFTVSQTIKLVIDAFNRKIDTEKLPFKKLLSIPTSYILVIAKKNGRRKSDLPNLDYDFILHRTGFSNFALIRLEALSEGSFKSSSSVSNPVDKRNSSFDVAVRHYSNSLIKKKTAEHNNRTTITEELMCEKNLKKRKPNYFYSLCERKCFC